MAVISLRSGDIVVKALAVALGASIGIKLFGGLPSDLSVPPEIVWTACSVEGLALSCLLFNRRVLGGVLVIFLAIAGTLVTILSPGRCGCLGPVVLSKAHHLWLLTAFGWAAASVVARQLERRSAQYLETRPS